MDALLGTLIGIMIVQGGALWYKIGKVEKGLAFLRDIVLKNNKAKED